MNNPQALTPADAPTEDVTAAQLEQRLDALDIDKLSPLQQHTARVCARMLDRLMT